MKQQTLKRDYVFEGKGLHSGLYSRVVLRPAPENTGIRFHRTDMGADAFVDALAANVSSTARSTTLCSGKVEVRTVEHVLSALTGMDVDNAIVEVDAPEMPILDGSARAYAEAIAADGVVPQNADRVWIELDAPVEYLDKKSGSYVRLTPADDLSYDVTIDFNSRVLGIQKVHFDRSIDYASQIAPCRTFCFFHEIAPLASLGLVKGGDVENAIVIIEKPVKKRQLDRMAKIFNQPLLSVTEKGYLSNLVLNFDDECGRHKLLDLMGDLRLAGGFIKAHIDAYKPGHSINTKTAKLI